MTTYRSKPTTIEAEQWFPGLETPGVQNARGDKLCGCVLTGGPTLPHVHTAHGDQPVQVQPGDWIIKEPVGDGYYPCKPDIFADRYHEVGPPTDIGALLDELDGLRKKTWSAGRSLRPQARYHAGLADAYPELRAYIRKAEKVIAAARDVGGKMSMFVNVDWGSVEAYYSAVMVFGQLHEEFGNALEQLAAALADLDEGDTDGD